MYPDVLLSLVASPVASRREAVLYLPLGPFGSAWRMRSPSVASCHVAAPCCVRSGALLSVLWVSARPCTRPLSRRGTVLCTVGGPFGSAWCMRSPFPVPSYDTMLYWRLLLPKARPASSSPAWLKELQWRSPRRWGIGWEAKMGVGPKKPGADMRAGG